MKLLMFSLVAVIAAAGSVARAGDTTTTAGDTTVTTKSWDRSVSDTVKVGPSATTVYTKPGQGADGPVQGNQSGSKSSTSYGGTVTWQPGFMNNPPKK